MRTMWKFPDGLYMKCYKCGKELGFDEIEWRKKTYTAWLEECDCGACRHGETCGIGKPPYGAFRRIRRLLFLPKTLHGDTRFLTLACIEQQCNHYTNRGQTREWYQWDDYGWCDG